MKTPHSILSKVIAFALVVVGMNITTQITSVYATEQDALPMTGDGGGTAYLYVGDENLYVSSGTKSNANGSATYNAENNTLTLDNYDGEEEIISNAGINIFFTGQNTVKHILSFVDLTINGDGKLTCRNSVFENGDFYSECITSNKGITINGGDLEITSPGAGLGSGDIININDGNISISSEHTGLYANILNINGGTLSIDAGLEAIFLRSYIDEDVEMNISPSIHLLESGLGIKEFTFNWHSAVFNKDGRGKFATIGNSDTTYNTKTYSLDNAAKIVHFGSEYNNELADTTVSEIEETLTIDAVGGPASDYSIILSSEDSFIEFNYVAENELSFDIYENKNEELLAKIADELNAKQKFVALDILVYDGENLVHEADDENGFRLTMPVPESLKGFDKIYFQLVSIDDVSGEISLGDKIEATIDEDGYLTVILPHLSTFIAVGDDDTVEVPYTGAFKKGEEGVIISLISCIITGILLASIVIRPKIRKYLR